MNLDLDEYIDNLRQGNLLSIESISKVCEVASEILAKEPNVLQISPPVTICSNIHGQFEDLLEIFRVGGEIPLTKYIFLGSNINFGRKSVEVMELLLCLKVKYPEHIYLLRGNHETEEISRVFGFYTELKTKYANIKLWKNFVKNIFPNFPLAAIIDKKIFCLYGGLSPKTLSIDEIQAIDRKAEKDPLLDILWSNPEEIEGWEPNSRGIGYSFGSNVVKKFNQKNGFELIVRGSQPVESGYRYSYKDKNLVTVWSVPNFKGSLDNFGAILVIDEDLNREMKILTSTFIRY